MKRKLPWLLLTFVVLLGAFLTTQSASSNSPNRHAAVPRIVAESSNLMPAFATTFAVDRTDDAVAATACTAAPNDCSLRGAIIAANANGSATPVIINLQPATTYSLTRTNATQENAASTGDLDITSSVHTVTIAGGGSSGPNATIIDAAGLNTGNFRDRAFPHRVRRERHSSEPGNSERQSHRRWHWGREHQPDSTKHKPHRRRHS